MRAKRFCASLQLGLTLSLIFLPAVAPADEPAVPAPKAEAPSDETPAEAPPPVSQPAAGSPEQPQAPNAQSGAPPGTPAAPPNSTVLAKDQIQGVLGKTVLSSNGEQMGEIANVIVDRNGQPRAAVIDFGGFLGVGSRKIAVDWGALHFAPADKPDQVTLDLTRDELKSAPAYEEGKPVVVIVASGSTQTVPANELP